MALGIAILAQELSWRFQTFDEVVAGIENALPALVEKYDFREPIELVIAGWSAERKKPESYVIETSDDTPDGMAEEAADTALLPNAFTLLELPPAVVGPVPNHEEIIAGSFPGWNLDAPPSEVVELLKSVIQMQRRSVYAGLPQYVGGFASLTTVRPDSIEQKILLRWPEDRVGEKIVLQ